MSFPIACVLHTTELASAMGEALREVGREYNFFAEASTFAASLARKVPRIVITEWHFPDGFDARHLCEMIRSQYQTPYIYLILLSNSSSPIHIATAQTLGVDDFVVEPFQPEKITERLQIAEKWLAHLDQFSSRPFPEPPPEGLS